MKTYSKWLIAILVVIALSVLWTMLPIKQWLNEFIAWVQRLGTVGILVFVITYAVATVLFLPGWIFTVSAGLIYGVVGGTAVALCGAVIGASLAFLVARYLLRRNIEQMTRSNPRFAAIDRAIGVNGWKIVGLLRLSPLVPFNLSNYFYGITSIGFGAYVLVSAIGMIPGTLLYAYLGAIGQASVSGGAAHHSIWQTVLLAIGLIATIVVTILVSRIAKNALKKTGAV